MTSAPIDLAREIHVVAEREVRRVASGAKGPLLLALFALCFVGSGVVFMRIAGALTQRVEDYPGVVTDLTAVGERAKTQLFTVLFPGDRELALSLASTPGFVLFFFVVSVATLPGLVSVISYEAISAELMSGAVRHTLLRTPRSAYVLGKTAAHLTVLSALLAIVLGALAVSQAVKDPAFQTWPALAGSARFLAASLVYGSTFVSIGIAASALTRRPLLSLISALLMIGAEALLLAIPDSSAFHTLRLLSPFHYVRALVSPDLLGSVKAAGALFGLGAAPLAATVFLFRRRDL